MIQVGRQIVAIRTHKWTAEEERLLTSLREIEGVDLAVVFHNRPEGLQLPIDVIDLDHTWLAEHELTHVPDWGWRCGDYFYYALRQARPDYSHYWLLEPDLYFAAPANDFFAQASRLDHDVLGVKITPMAADHRFSHSMREMALFRSIFALTRMSGTALDNLFEARRAYCKLGFGARFHTNDEIFCFSTAMADATLTCGSFSDLIPDWSTAGTLEVDPDILIDTLEGVDAKAIYHPVRGRDSFKSALANRLAARFGVLRSYRASLAVLDDQDISDIGDMVAKRVHAELARLRRRAGR